MSRKDDLINQIVERDRLLQKHKLKKARQGDAAHSSLDIEIEDSEAKLEELQAELKELGEAEDIPVLVTAPSDRERVLRWAKDGRKDSLYGINVSGEKLPSVDLSGADMRAANLTKTELRWSNLKQTDLRTAYLREANLCRTSLTEAKLIGADLSNANLSKANLVGADLSDAVLKGANLSGANLSGARCAQDTTWPEGFDFAAAGIILEDSE